ncbi:MAG: hypothetical protein UW43_C0001G0050 [Candidatus Yanofskybacteria bacterium GW2011_GWA1_44_21]|uniref:DUF4012 domain-containing protein n=2 Tax=Candidatus Yanofskyibacteriota TaxID=1752733 RepID=A0A0G1NBG5_9BACT|nr:MAG: hypothetical protein UW43_C0001G0050 [Candidatus Yanofskybacteria bacterium GW2011_GWA1_44_21]KKT90457.1 MAG: hypothetical protein UW90_C0001G0045 [Candidatus Yanofskybacteria bacterium GW2011_GWB1_45_11]
MPRNPYHVMGAMFDVKPVDETGRVAVSETTEISALVCLRKKKEKNISLPETDETSDIKIEPILASQISKEDILREFEIYLREQIPAVVRLEPIREEQINVALKHIRAPVKFVDLETVQNPVVLAEERSATRATDLDVALSSYSNPKKGKSGTRIFIVLVIVALSFLGSKYIVGAKKQVVQQSSSAVQNLEEAKAKLETLDFNGASGSFLEAYEQFSKAGDNLNFMGSTLGSLLADLPGAEKLKSANNLIQAGQLIADAGKAMTEAMDGVWNSSGKVNKMAESLRNAFNVSNGNIKKAGTLLANVDVLSLPEEKQSSFEAFKSKLPEFEKLISVGLDYAKFFDDLTGSSGTKKFLIMFQNPSELRPTGGFPGSYGVLMFQDGDLADFKVDDVYNLDGQLKENIIPPKQLQHITPTWGMRDANWFIDFPASAKKIMSFYKKESGSDIDGVITLSPKLVSGILDVIGPIDMPEYGLTLTGENFTDTIQKEVEYGPNRAQPKQILVDFAPKLLEKIYSSDSQQWMDIFNMIVMSIERKDILMYFKELKLQSFAYDHGLSGHVKNTDGDYMMITFSNVKGSKTDAVIDNSISVNTQISDELAHTVSISRKHNGGKNQYGFYNKQNPTYVRILAPAGSQLKSIKGNSKPDFRPLLGYADYNFKKDEDLSGLEATVHIDAKTGVDVYRESGKTGFGFWLITNPGETKTVTIQYSVPDKYIGGDYNLYMQKQPGLIVDEFNYSLSLPSNTAVIESQPTLDRISDGYILSRKFDNDIDLKIKLK